MIRVSSVSLAVTKTINGIVFTKYQRPNVKIVFMRNSDLKRKLCNAHLTHGEAAVKIEVFYNNIF